MSEPILASTLQAEIGAQSFDLTILDHVLDYMFQSGAPSNIDKALLQRLITSASAAIQSWLGYDPQSGSVLAATAYTEMLDAIIDGMGWPSAWVYPITVSWPPILSVLAVTMDGISIPSGGDPIKKPGYFIDSNPAKATQIFVSGYWPIIRGRKTITVAYTGGYAAIPYEVEQACLETIALRYKEIDRIGVRSKSLAQETVSYIVTELSPSAQAQLQPYRRIVTP
jgi:hypothetical protein